MIQRTRVKTPIHKEIITNPKPNKKVKLLNEFTGGNKLTNKLVNENNIVINMPVPVLKKKRKKVSKISDEAKKHYQETALQYLAGSFPPLDFPDITKVKTNDDLNKLTNQMLSIMGKAPILAIKGGNPSLSIMDGKATPLALAPVPSSTTNFTAPVESYEGNRGPAFTNIVKTPTIEQGTSSSSPAPSSPAPSATAPSTPASAPSAPRPTENLFNKLLLKIEPIVNKKNIDEPYFDEFNKAFKTYSKNAEIYNSIFVTNQSAKTELINFVSENYSNNSEIKIRILQEYLHTYMELKKWWFIQSQTGQEPTIEQIKQPFLGLEGKTNEELEIIVTQPIEEILKQYEDVYNNPDTFYNTFYKNGVFTEIQNRPSKIELQNIIKLISPSYPLGKKTKKGSSTKTDLNKLELATIFKDEYNKSKKEVSDTDTDKKVLNDFYNKWYPNATFIGNEDVLPRQKLADMTDLVNSYSNSTTKPFNKLKYSYLVNRFQKDYLEWITNEPTKKPKDDDECLDSSRRTADCIKITDYYRYLTYLSDSLENQVLTNEYIIATGDDFEFITSDNNIKIQKIKEIDYKPTRTKNPDFFTWAEQNKITVITPDVITSKSDEYKKELMTLNIVDDKEKIDMYFNNLQQWNAENGSFERIKRNLTTQEKLDLLIKLKDSFQYNQAIKTQDFDNIASNRENNEVKLCLSICEETYIAPNARQNISQLIYDSTLSTVEVAIYKDQFSDFIYFGSRGSITAQDWFQTDLAILLGVETSRFSPRLQNEINILKQVVASYKPSIVIFTGHSMGGFASNELFIYTLMNIPSINQPFSITFNSGSGVPAYYRNNPFDANFIMSHVLQFHVKGDALSATQNISPFGAVVNVPASSFLVAPNHFLSAFEGYDFKQFENFVDVGLTIPEPNQIITEPEPTSEPSTEKEQTLMDLLNKLYQLDTNERYNKNTEQYNNIANYYDNNREYFNKIDMEEFIQKYTTDDDEFNFYTQIFMDLQRRPIKTPEIDANQADLKQKDTTVIPETQTEEKPLGYTTPYGLAIGGTIGTAIGAIGGPIPAIGLGTVGATIGGSIQNAIEGNPYSNKPTPPRPVLPVPKPKPAVPLPEYLFGISAPSGVPRFGFKP